MNKPAFTALTLATLSLTACNHAASSKTGNRATMVSVETAEITDVGFAKCNGGDITQQKVHTVRMKLKNVFQELKDGSLGRDIDKTYDDPTILDGDPVDNPNSGSDWSTDLDATLKKQWFDNGYMVLRVMLLRSVGTGPNPDVRNKFVEFLAPKSGSHFDAVRKGIDKDKDAPEMICGRSDIQQISIPIHDKKPDGTVVTKIGNFDYIDIYFQKPISVNRKDESINIGLLVGPSGGKRLPVFLDPKVHNDGMP